MSISQNLRIGSRPKPQRRATFITRKIWQSKLPRFAKNYSPPLWQKEELFLLLNFWKRPEETLARGHPLNQLAQKTTRNFQISKNFGSRSKSQVHGPPLCASL